MSTTRSASKCLIEAYYVRFASSLERLFIEAVCGEVAREKGLHKDCGGAAVQRCSGFEIPRLNGANHSQVLYSNETSSDSLPGSARAGTALTGCQQDPKIKYKEAVPSAC